MKKREFSKLIKLLYSTVELQRRGEARLWDARALAWCFCDFLDFGASESVNSEKKTVISRILLSCILFAKISINAARGARSGPRARKSRTIFLQNWNCLFCAAVLEKAGVRWPQRRRPGFRNFLEQKKQLFFSVKGWSFFSFYEK